MATSRQQATRKNVADPERWASIVAGGLLGYLGWRRGWQGTLQPRSTASLVLGALLGGTGAVLAYRGATGHCPAYEQLGIDTASASGKGRDIEVEEAITVQASRQEVYDFWRDVERFPQFMRHLETVEDRGEGRSHWTARAPKDVATVSWDAEITEDEPGERLAWRSLPGADIENSGSVRFAEAPKGATEVHVRITYRPPDTAVNSLVSRLLNSAFEQLVKEDARRFKHLMETGEMPTIEGQPQGGR